MFRKENMNPIGAHVGDCTVRAIAKATDKTWEKTYAWLCIYGFFLKDMPSSNRVWGAYLKDSGFSRYKMPDTCPDCYSVEQFIKDNPKGTFLLALESHVVCVKNGDLYDTWDSSEEPVIFVWRKDEK